jgi:UDP-N-acetylmuramoyl-L-alanyl-D-glutamate--2,6-diaminopimelate ligase
MTLGDLLRDVNDARGPLTDAAGVLTFDESQIATADAARGDVSSIAYDSRHVTTGAVFVALRGQQADGSTFAREAISRGAQAVISEGPAPGDVNVPWLQVPDARLALAVLAAALYRRPSEELTLVGITGTNGKTTTSYLLSSVFEAGGIPCGRIGTVGYRIGSREFEAARTTPEAPELQRLMRDMVKQGCGACVMEVSSHALSLRRADELRFAAAIFTNLTRDHLDFHRDMAAYFVAKRRLFELLPPGAPAVINLDDRSASNLLPVVDTPVTYAIDAAADVQAGPLSLSLDGLRFDIRTPRGTVHIESQLVGRPNAYNILAAVAAADALGIPQAAIEDGIRTLTNVPGRFQVVSGAGDDVRVVVDYAHTDDALKNLLETARPLASGRVITVFGCGGDRDRSKRPLMGAVAARLSDLVIVTSDNPRSEEPEQIIEDIKRGIVMPADRAPRGQAGPKSTPFLAIPDRKTAIDTAVRDARQGDLVLVAGKGHEKYQIVGERVLPFDDVEIAAAALTRRRTATRAS